ncbi:MAG: glycoside hydrolase family 127 protein [Bacteroidales bacterium]|nr:glycoside hydrolase family 127 protein [Bacteroidales bacterium]
MKYSVLGIIVTALIVIAGCKKPIDRPLYPVNPKPLVEEAYIKLPLGSVRPEGWLEDQMEIQADGLTGHLDEFWEDLVDSGWKGKGGESWERGPYYLDGLVPLAYILNDNRLKLKVEEWMDFILNSSRPDGWFGPEITTDRWPLAVALKVLMEYYEATGNQKALEVITGYFRYLHENDPDWPDKEWRGVRAMEHAVTGYWLYNRLKEPWILETIESIQNNSFDWSEYYLAFPWDSTAVAEGLIPHNWQAEGLTAHVVNNAMAIKYPGLWYQQSQDERHREAVFTGIDNYISHHDQAAGRFSGDEHLSGKSPAQGTEMCAVVEYMYSLEKLFSIFGDISLSDRLEYLAYNALPGTMTADGWTHQYDQQSNQVLVSVAKRNWSTNRDESNIYGLMPNYPCCLANMHQGWPKFVEHMWMATHDNGLIATVYGPSSVRAKVGKGVSVEITEETNYPFDGYIDFKIQTDKKVEFPLYLRIPGWCKESTIEYRSEKINAKGGEIVKLSGKWENGDTISLTIPFDIRTERRYNNSISVLRGPLYYSLRIDKEYSEAEMSYKKYNYMGATDWQIKPTTDWNYGLLVDAEKPEESITVEDNTIGEYPFADKGDLLWSAENKQHITWDKEAPVVIKVQGVKIPGWGLKDNSAADPPPSPVISDGEIVELELVPYGCAKLRITEFPLIKR